jgi:CHASE2 domain-containing sensor protein
MPRDRVATLLDRVRSLGAVVVGLDLLFTEPDAAGKGSAGRTVADGAVRPTAGLSTRDASLAAARGARS